MFYRLKNMRKGLRRFTAAALAVLSVSQLASAVWPNAGLVEEASAAELKNTYVMQVATGNSDGGSVTYFTIEYLDTDDKERVEVVFTETAAAISNASGGTQMNKRLKYASDMGFSLDDWEIDTTPLGRMSTNSFIISTPYTIKEITAIGLHSDTGTSWVPKYIQFYRATQISGTEMYGYISPDRYLSFNGTLMAQADIEGAGIGASGINFTGAGDSRFFGNPRQIEKQADAFPLICYPEDYNHSKKDYKEGKITYKQFASLEEYQAATTLTNSTEEYLMEINLADVGGGGIESLSALYDTAQIGKSSDYAECLAVTMRYRDTIGNYRQVFMPITVSMLCWYNETAEDRGETKRVPNDIATVAVQGESLRFVGNFPGLDEVVELCVYYGVTIVTSAAENYGVGRVGATQESKTTFSGAASMADRAAVIATSKDSIAIAGINLQRIKSDTTISQTLSSKYGRVYYGEESVANDGISNTEVVSYYAASSDEGVKIEPNNLLDITENQIVQKPTGTVNLEPAVSAGTYQVKIQADSLEQAGTVNKMYATLHYTDEDGHQTSTSAIDIEKAVMEYAGYWPGCTHGASVTYRSQEEMLDNSDVPAGVASNWFGGYRRNARCGETLSFFVQIDDVARFTGMTLSMNSNVDDDYQLSSVEISEVSDKGELMCVYKDWAESGTGSMRAWTDRYWERIGVKQTQKISYKPAEGILVQNNVSVEIDFTDATGQTTTDTTDENNAIGSKQVSYEESLRKYGLTDVRTAYNVSVKVADDEYTTVTDGDTGSKNQFYFQLVFDKDGTEYTSSYVNANQQLESDGFRAGETATFKIYTNGDYGDVKKVNIIPDDISYSGDSFDKLKISTITVTKTSVGGTDMSYVIDNVGWIDIDVNDDESDYVGRPDSEIVRSFAVQRTAYTTKLEFAFLNSASTCPTDATNAGPVRGSYTVSFEYRDSNGMLQTTKDIDLVGLLQDYINKQQSTTAETAGDTLSDTTYMFQPGRTNRFTYSFDNIVSLRAVTFKAKAADGTSGVWGIDNLSVKQVSGTGTLRLKAINATEAYAYGEYIRDYGIGNSMNLCTQAEGQGNWIIEMGNRQYNSKRVLMAENKISAIDGDDGSIVVETPEHESVNDTATLSLIPMASSGLKNGDVITANVTYRDVYGDSRYVEGVKLEYSVAADKFVSKGMLDAQYFCIPYTIELSAPSTMKNITLGKVVMTQYRGEAVKGEFTSFGISGGDTVLKCSEGASLKLAYRPEENQSFSDKYNQTMYISFARETRSTTINGDNDIKISFRYQNVNDSESKTYTSEIRALSGEGISRIEPGMVIAIPFNVDSVKWISDVVITTNNSAMKVYVDRVAVQQTVRSNVSSDDYDGDITYQWFNCSLAESKLLTVKNTRFSAAESTMAAGMASTERLCPVELTIKTAANSGSVASDASGTVSMVVSYMDTNKLLRTYTVSDLERVLSEGSLTAGDTAKVNLLLPGAAKVMQVAFTPTDSSDETTAAWKVESLAITGNVGIAGETLNCPELTVNDWAVEDDPLYLNVYGTLLKATFKYGSTGRTIKNTDVNPRVAISSSMGTTFSAVTASPLALPTNVTWVVSYCLVNEDSEGAVTVVSNGAGFTLERGNTYRIRVYPSEMPSLVVTWDVVMPAAVSSGIGD